MIALAGSVSAVSSTCRWKSPSVRAVNSLRLRTERIRSGYSVNSDWMNFSCERQVGFRLALAPFLGFVLGIQQQAAHGVANENDIVGDAVLGGGQLVAAVDLGGAGGDGPKRQPNARQQQHDQQPEAWC